MVTLIHHMGGSIRRDFKVEKTTHLVASPASTTGEKHKVHSSIPIIFFINQTNSLEMRFWVIKKMCPICLTVSSFLCMKSIQKIKFDRQSQQK